MKRINLAILALAMALLVAPAFAANDASLNFHALSGIASDAQEVTPTILTDEQLASVEGGEHITAARLFISQAQTATNSLVRLFSLLSARQILTNYTVHPCNGIPC